MTSGAITFPVVYTYDNIMRTVRRDMGPNICTVNPRRERHLDQGTVHRDDAIDDHRHGVGDAGDLQVADRRERVVVTDL